IFKMPKNSDICQNPKTTKISQNTKTIENLLKLTSNNVLNASVTTPKFKVDSHDFDLELRLQTHGFGRSPGCGK
ncbi:hypothetical protein PJI17_31730, partial [Mycobacterium kansasii]